MTAPDEPTSGGTGPQGTTPEPDATDATAAAGSSWDRPTQPGATTGAAGTTDRTSGPDTSGGTGPSGSADPGYPGGYWQGSRAYDRYPGSDAGPGGAGPGGPGPGGPGGPGAPGGTNPPPGYGYGWEPRRLYRSSTDRVFAGVLAGLAEHFGWDVSLTRLVFVVLAIVTGFFPFLVLYIVMAVVIPLEPMPGAAGGAPGTAGAGPSGGPIDPNAPAGAYRPRPPAANPGAAAVIFGVILIAVGAMALLNRYLFIDWSVLWPLLLVAFGVVLLGLAASRRT